MEDKIKQCAAEDCQNEFKLYRTTDKYCSFKCCLRHSKPKQRKTFKPINKHSLKRLKEIKIYTAKRVEFLSRNENKFCAVYPGIKSGEIHHKYSGKDRAKYFLDETTWLAVSRQGHNWIHDNPKEARELNLLY